MPYELENRLVIGVASSAVFDLVASDAVFKSQGRRSTANFSKNTSMIRFQRGLRSPSSSVCCQ